MPALLLCTKASGGERIEKMKLWKDNMIDQEWELSNEEIVKRFKQSKHYQSFKEGMHLRTALSIFISSKSGLSSVFEIDEFEALTEVFMAREDEGMKR